MSLQAELDRSEVFQVSRGNAELPARTSPIVPTTSFSRVTSFGPNLQARLWTCEVPSLALGGFSTLQEELEANLEEFVEVVAALRQQDFADD